MATMHNIASEESQSQVYQHIYTYCCKSMLWTN